MRRWCWMRRRQAKTCTWRNAMPYTGRRRPTCRSGKAQLRQVFHEAADRIVIGNTKGFTGHAMGTGIEDVVAVKALETVEAIFRPQGDALVAECRLNGIRSLPGQAEPQMTTH